MKGITDFHFIDSQPVNFADKDLILDYDENNLSKSQLSQNGQLIQNDAELESLMKTPKSKKSRKSSLKNNPEDILTPKIPKIKQKKYKTMQADKQKNPNQLFGHWSIQENKRYHWFLQIYNSHFMNRSLRRMDRIFTSMAKFVNTREAQQCRSHHQKMQKKYKTFPKILLNLRTNHYGSSCLDLLKSDMQQNQVQMNQSLLTEQFLTENINAYLSLSSQIIEGEEQISRSKEKTINQNHSKNIFPLSSSATKPKRNNPYKVPKQKQRTSPNNNKQILSFQHSLEFEQQKISHHFNHPLPFRSNKHNEIEEQVDQVENEDQNMMQSLMVPDLESSKNFFKILPNHHNPNIDQQGNNLFGDNDSNLPPFGGFYEV